MDLLLNNFLNIDFCCFGDFWAFSADISRQNDPEFRTLSGRRIDLYFSVAEADDALYERESEPVSGKGS